MNHSFSGSRRQAAVRVQCGVEPEEPLQYARQKVHTSAYVFAFIELQRHIRAAVDVVVAEANLDARPLGVEGCKPLAGSHMT